VGVGVGLAAWTTPRPQDGCGGGRAHGFDGDCCNGVIVNTSLRYSIRRRIDDHDEVVVSEGDWGVVSLL